MRQKMTWEEMKTAYPDEWVLAIDYEVDDMGEVALATVIAHSTDKDEIYSHQVDAEKVGVWFTGESQFRGFRSHAENNTI